MVCGMQEALSECVPRDPALILCICSHCYGYTYQQGLGITEFISPWVVSGVLDKVHGLSVAGPTVIAVHQNHQGD